MINDTIKEFLIWHFTLVWIKINYGQIGDQTGLFYTTNPVFYTSGNRFVRRTFPHKIIIIFFRKHTIINMNCLWQPCLLMDRDELSNLYRGPPIDASYQVSVHLTQWFQRRILKKNRPIRNKNCLWQPCLLMDRDEISNLYRGPSIDASY